MLITSENCSQGNRAIASVLLLYYHLIREGGITHEQTVYLTQDDFDPFTYLTVEVSKNQRSEIDEALLREGAVICLLCELNDLVTDYEVDYLRQPFTQKILEALARSAGDSVPEALVIAQEVSAGESKLNYKSLGSKLDSVFKMYVIQRFKVWGQAREA